MAQRKEEEKEGQKQKPISWQCVEPLEQKTTTYCTQLQHSGDQACLYLCILYLRAYFVCDYGKKAKQSEV